MSKKKVLVTFSIPVEVKAMLEELALLNFATKTRVIVDMIRKDYRFWINKNIKEEEENDQWFS